MSYKREISRLAHKASLSLGVGRSPALWRRELAQSTTRLGLLGWASAWIEAFVAIEMRLCDGPLLGRCIVELTAYQERAAQSDTANHLPRRSIPAEPLPVGHQAQPQPSNAYKTGETWQNYLSKIADGKSLNLSRLTYCARAM